jgi:two-component system chemotaxis response regulator CheY
VGTLREFSTPTIQSHWDSKGQQILLIEDNPSIRETFKIFLEEEGYQVLTACNGIDALRVISETGEPAAIFLDLNMPEMDGATFLRERSRANLATRTPVIVFTAIGRKMRLEGVSEWVKKPVELDRLLHIVSKYCNQYVLH